MVARFAFFVFRFSRVGPLLNMLRRTNDGGAVRRRWIRIFGDRRYPPVQRISFHSWTSLLFGDGIETACDRLRNDTFQTTDLAY